MHAGNGVFWLSRSIFYKNHLPMIIVFNKTDVEPYDFAQEWMEDFEKFQDFLKT